MNTAEPNIFNYHDYRAYLRDMLHFYKKTKVTNRKLSLRKLATKLKVSPSLISMILSKERNLTEDLAEKLAYEFALNGQQASYLKILLSLCDTTDNETRVKAFQKLKRFHEFRKKNQTDIEAHQYIADWYNVVIREMVNLGDFSKDEKVIQEKLIETVPIDRIRKSLSFLSANGYILEDEKGHISADKKIDCSGGIYKLSLSKFYEDILKVAAKSIYSTESDRRYLVGHTVALSKQKYDKVVQLIDKALKEIQGLESVGSNEAVYHISLMAFPLTKKRQDE
jgi:uncharacterized protein (TIGR02147 family)